VGEGDVRDLSGPEAESGSVRAVVAASMLITTVLTAHTASARDASDDPVPVTEATDDTQDQAVEAVVEQPVDPRVECIIQKESGGLDVPNRQGSGAWGPGQYFPSTWAAHTALYRRATGYGGPLSLHSLADVRRVMAYVLSAYPWMRSAWTVRGC
jgi:hypothetical protein